MRIVFLKENIIAFMSDLCQIEFLSTRLLVSLREIAVPLLNTSNKKFGQD